MLGFAPSLDARPLNSHSPAVALCARAMGVSHGDYEKIVAAGLGKAVSEASPWVRVWRESLPSIFSARRLKNAFDGVPSSGEPDLEWRAEREMELFGIPPYAGPCSRPIYGYLSAAADAQVLDVVESFGDGEPSHSTSLWNYGDVAFRLTDAVKGRSTVTFGDSLQEESVRPAPALAPDVYCVTLKTFPLYALYPGDFAYRNDGSFGPVGITDVDGFSPYAELQVHEGVTLGDIEEAVFETCPSPAEAAALAGAGIPWRTA